jgi:hypothetical protein
VENLLEAPVPPPEVRVAVAEAAGEKLLVEAEATVPADLLLTTTASGSSIGGFDLFYRIQWDYRWLLRLRMKNRLPRN